MSSSHHAGPPAAAQPRLVVAGLVLRGPAPGPGPTASEALISRRRPGGPLGGYWEFPGGKLEPGEAPEQGLRRELREELGIEVEVGRIVDVVHYRYPERAVLILLYRCRLLEGTPRPLEVAEVRWVPLGELVAYDFLPADRPLVARLSAEGVG